MKRFAVLALAVLAAAVSTAAEEPRRLSLELKDVTLDTVAKTIARKASVSVEVAPAARDARISILVESRTPEEALRAAAKLAGVPLTVLPDGSFLLGKRTLRSASEINETLESSVVSFRVQEVGLAQLLEDVSGQIGVPVLIDPVIQSDVASVQVTLTVRDLPAVNVLQLVCAYSGGAMHRARWGTVLFTTQEQLARLPERFPPPPAPDVTESDADGLARSLIETTEVSFRADRIPLADVLDLISKRCSVRISVSPEALEKTAKARVRWEVEKAPAGAVLALLLPRRGLRCRLADGVLIVEPKD